jgi:hypothetical protein
MTLVCLSLCGLIGALWIATGSGVSRSVCSADRYRRNDRRVSNCDLPDPGGVL